MRVRVLFFAVLRETFGREQWVELPAAHCSVAALLTHLRAKAGPAMTELWPRLAVAVNQRYARASDVIADGDEVALLPPVSGGLSSQPSGVCNVLLTRAEIQSAQAVATLKAGGDGAVVVFDGIVRDNTRGRKTEYLLYEAYEEMALSEMRTLVEQARERFAVREALLHHRLGRLDIGETSVLIAAYSAHRAAAFDACRWLIDTLKKTVPIWKKEFFVDGAVWADGEPFPEDLR